MNFLQTYRQSGASYILWILIIIVAVIHCLYALALGWYQVAFGEAFIAGVCAWACTLERELTRRNFPKETE